MAREKSTLNIIGKGILSTLESFFSTLNIKLTERSNEFMKNIENKVISIEKILILILFNYLTILLGLIFLLISLYFFLREYFNLSRSVIYLIFGVLFLIIGIIRIQFTRRMKGGK